MPDPLSVERRRSQERREQAWTAAEQRFEDFLAIMNGAPIDEDVARMACALVAGDLYWRRVEAHETPESQH
jgi:predicted nucleic acid-binding protein